MINTVTDRNGTNITINIGDKFDYASHKDFRDAYKNHNQKSSFIVNLSKTKYMDSSALGMLILLKEHADRTGSEVTLTRATDSVQKILKIANFNSLFKIK